MKPAVKILPDWNFYSRGYHILFYVDIPAPSLAFKLFEAVTECAHFCFSFRVSLGLWVLKEAHLVLNCFEWNWGRTLTSNLNLLTLGRLGTSVWLVRVVCELLFSPHSGLNFYTPPGVFPPLSHTVIQPVLFLPVLTSFAASSKNPVPHCSFPPSSPHLYFSKYIFSLPAPFPLSTLGIENGIIRRKCLNKLGRIRNVIWSGNSP